MNNHQEKKGFTLIELLVVIAILATLAVAVTLILNPAELVRQGRDSTRLSDLAALQSAISLYLADAGEPTLDGDNLCTAAGTSPTNGTCTTNASTTVDGTGWVDIDFTSISSGAPLSRLPIDPVNSTTYFYVFDSDSTNITYELNAAMESVRYSNGGDDDVETTDGGDNANWYEIGNDPELDL